MSADIESLKDDDEAANKTPTEGLPSTRGAAASRSVLRRKGVRKANSGRVPSSTRQHRGTERSRSASSATGLTPNSTRQRISKLSPRPSMDVSVASTNSPTSEDERSNDSLENEIQLEKKKKSLKQVSKVRTQINRINKECGDALDNQKSRSAPRRTRSRSDEAEVDVNKKCGDAPLDNQKSRSAPRKTELDIVSPRPTPTQRTRKKPSSVLSCDDSLAYASPSLNASASSIRTNSTKQHPSSGKSSGESEKSKRHSRRSRTPLSKKDSKVPNSDSNSEQNRGPVSEDEILQLLSATDDPPLVTSEEETQQKAARRKKQGKSSRSESLEADNREKRHLKKQPGVGERRRSISSGTPERNTRAVRRYSNEGDIKTEKREKKEKTTRRLPGRSRSNNIGVDKNGLDSFFQHSASGRRKKTIGSRSVLSSSKSVNLSGSGPSRSSKNRRRRKDIHDGKSAKSVSPECLVEERHRDEKNDGEYSGSRRSFDDADLIGESDYDSDGDDRSVDLDLATARDNFAQQNLNEKLQIHLTKTDELLYSVFPKHVADALRNGQKVAPENHDLVTIFFSDIVGFTDISAKLDPLKISDMLDRLYNSFDALSDYHDVFKVETIGDAYMAVTNLTKDQPDHCKRITEFAIDAIRVANQTLIDEENPSMGFVNVRVGFHSGSVVSNVVGTRNPRYCLFGDTVNTASRMESNSEKNRIHCSEYSATLLRQQCPRMRIFPRGSIDVKGKGEMKTFWVHTEGSSSVSDKNGGAIRNFMKAVRKK